jgi:predicted rRNA methylase
MNRQRGREHLHGIAPVEAALRAERRSLHTLWCRAGRPGSRIDEVAALARERGVTARTTSDDDLERRAGSATHQGVVLECGALPLGSLRDLLDSPPGAGEVVLALDQVEDPQNVGGLIRTAAFLGARAVLLHRARRAPLTATVSKASAGTLEWFPLVESGNLADSLLRLAREGWRVLGSALDDDAVDHRAVEPGPATVLVVGNEGRGIRPLTAKRCDALVTIEGRGGAESLNVTVAAGIMLARLCDGTAQT